MGTDQWVADQYARAIAQSPHDDVRFFFFCSTSAALPLRQSTSQKGHSDIGTIFLDLLHRSYHGIIQCIAAEHTLFVPIDKEVSR